VIPELRQLDVVKVRINPGDRNRPLSPNHCLWDRLPLELKFDPGGGLDTSQGIELADSEPMPHPYGLSTLNP